MLYKIESDRGDEEPEEKYFCVVFHLDLLRFIFINYSFLFSDLYYILSYLSHLTSTQLWITQTQNGVRYCVRSTQKKAPPVLCSWLCLYSRSARRAFLSVLAS